MNNTTFDLKKMTDQELAEYAKDCHRDGMVDHILGEELARRFSDLVRQRDDLTAPRTNQDSQRAKFYASKMEDFVNDYGMDREGFANDMLRWHRTNQQSFISLMLHCIAKFATEGSTDPRNELGVKTCQKLYNFMEENFIATKLPMI